MIISIICKLTQIKEMLNIVYDKEINKKNR